MTEPHNDRLFNRGDFSAALSIALSPAFSMNLFPASSFALSKDNRVLRPDGRRGGPGDGIEAGIHLGENLNRILGLCLMLVLASSGMVYADEYSAKQGEGGGERIRMAAEDADNDDLFIIEESAEETDTKTGGRANRGWEYMTKHFGGEVIGSYAGIGDANNERSGIQGRLRFREDWSWGGAVVEAIAYYSRVDLTLGRGENGDEDLFSQTFEASDQMLREAYVRADPFEWWRLIAGRQVVSIGQFDIFSPVDFVLPVDFTNTRLSYNKVEYRLPQDALRNNFYLGNWRLETVWFPTLRSDDFTRVVQSAPQQYYDPTQDRDVTVKTEFPADENQYLLRLMYEGNDLTYGFTFYDGYDLFALGGATHLLLKEEGPGPSEARPRADWYYREIRPSTQRRRAYGFELAKQINKFSVKFELLAERGIEILNFITSPDELLNADERRYVDFILNENGGRLDVEREQILAALGFDYYNDKNFFNVYLLGFQEFLDSRSRRAVELADRAYPDQAVISASVFPAFNMGGFYGERKQHTVGFIGGFLSFALGGSVYYLNDYYESFQYGVSLEALQYLSNFVYGQQAANEDDETMAVGDETGVQQRNPFTVGLRVGFEYSF